MKKLCLISFATVACFVYSFTGPSIDSYIYTIPFHDHPWNVNVDLFNSVDYPSKMKMAEIVWSYEAVQERMFALESINGDGVIDPKRPLGLKFGDLYNGSGVSSSRIVLPSARYSIDELRTSINSNEKSFPIRPKVGGIISFNDSASGFIGQLYNLGSVGSENYAYAYIDEDSTDPFSQITNENFSDDDEVGGFGILDAFSAIVNDRFVFKGYSDLSDEYKSAMKSGQPPSMAVRSAMVYVPKLCKRALAVRDNSIYEGLNGKKLNVYHIFTSTNIGVSATTTYSDDGSYRFITHTLNPSLDTFSKDEYEDEEEEMEIYGHISNISKKNRYFNLTQLTRESENGNVEWLNSYSLGAEKIYGEYQKTSYDGNELYFNLCSGTFYFKDTVSGTPKTLTTIKGVVEVYYHYEEETNWTVGVSDTQYPNATTLATGGEVKEGVIFVPVTFTYSHSKTVEESRTDNNGNEYKVNKVLVYFKVSGIDFNTVVGKIYSLAEIDEITNEYSDPELDTWTPVTETVTHSFSYATDDYQSIERDLDFEIGNVIIDTGKMSFNTEVPNDVQ